jgi:hypothetical protein
MKTCLTLFCAASFLVQQLHAGEKALFGEKEYIEYLPGTLPLIISAPHGGTLKPADIPNRTEGKVAQDSNTQELSRLIRDEMQRQYGGTPHLIICRLHRLKLDANREIKEAAQGNPQAEKAWHEFQNFINQAREQVTKEFGAGLYIDLHGHRHIRGWVELGYALNAQKLDLSDEQLNSDPSIVAASTLPELDKRSPVSFAALLRGPDSLGALLAAEGFASVPSPQVPTPGANDYFSGGYNSQTHGSMNGGTISGLQVECPWGGVRDKPESRQKFAAALANCLGPFFKAHFQMELKALKK